METERALRQLEEDREQLQQKVEELHASNADLQTKMTTKNQEIRDLKTEFKSGLERSRLDRMRKERQREVARRKVVNQVESLMINQEYIVCLLLLSTYCFQNKFIATHNYIPKIHTCTHYTEYWVNSPFKHL